MILAIKQIALTITTALMLVSVMSCCNPETAQTPYDEYMKAAEDVWRFQGTVLVAQNDSVLFRKGYGLAQIESNRPNTPETKFLLASTTKPFTAIAIMQLYQQGLIDLQKPISTYVPNYPKETGDRLTIHHLLSHTSGIPDIIGLPEYRERLHEYMSPDTIIAYFKNLPLLFAPGERYAYSSANYILLGEIIENLTGIAWDEYIQQNICTPLDLHNTGVYYDYAARDDFAVGYAPDREGNLNALPPINPSCGYSAGALASTVDDLYKIHLALYDTVLLNQKAINIMLTPYTATYGYGWLIDDLGGHHLTAHGGGAPGYVSIWQRWLDDSLCVIVLSNVVTIPAHVVATGLAAITLDEPYDLPIMKQPLSLSPDELKIYEGDYQLESGEIRHIRVQSQHLTAQRGEGTPYVILPDADDRFFFANDQMTTISFLRDPEGKITGHVVRLAFSADPAIKLE